MRRASKWLNLYGRQTWAKKRAKNTNNVLLALFWAHVGHSDGNICWSTLMPLTSIYPTNPRTNPWNFCEKILRIGEVENLRFFWISHFEFFFCFIPIKISHKLCDGMNGMFSLVSTKFLAMRNISLYSVPTFVKQS